MALELQQLRQVLALAEHGSFVRAAAVLHISQPALSRSIQNLERRFGSDLFVRSRSGAVPTDLGRLYIERARDVLRMADELDQEAASHGNLQSGRVAVGGGPFPADAVLGRAAAKFIEQHPGVSLKVRARNWDELARELRSRELDFFVAEASTLHREPDLEVMPLPAYHPLYLVARAGHPLAGRGRVSIEDALEWPMVTPGRVPPRVLDPLLAAHRTASKRIAAVRPFPAVECNSLATVKRVVANSDAITGTILPCISSELESGQLVLVSQEPWLHLQYGVTSLKGVPRARVAERFLEFVLDAEREAALEEQRLIAKFDAGSARRRNPRKA
jgi:DNA-binding transcriptional LysR family regulator